MMKKLYTRMSFAALALLLCTSLVLAQERTVSGTVSDESGVPIPGVNVLLKGTTTGTASDADGKYSISVSGSDAVLVFSFIGYTTSEVVVGGRTTVDVSLAADVQTLNELVVTGYSEQRTRDITGAVTVVNAEELKQVKAANFGQMLAGRAAGVTTSTSGQPGSGTNIRVRGISSFGASDPLIIIDGIQIEGDKALNALNPNDIESMQVLKDAGAASIYGSRASAGVIVITTKQGKAGQVKVSYDGYAGVQSAVKGYNDFLVKDPEQYMEYQLTKFPTDADLNGFYADGVPDIFYAPPGWDGDRSKYFPYGLTGGYLIMESNLNGTDWWDETFRTDALITDHNVGISGGSDKASFHASVNYFKQDGTMRYTGVERFSARLNSTFTAGKFRFGQSLSFARVTGVNQAGGNQNEQNVMTQILKLNSIVPVYDIGGNYAGAKQVGFSNGTSPIAMAWRNKENEYLNNRVLGSFFGEFNFTNWLKARTVFGLDYGNNFTPNFVYPRWEVRETNATSSYQETWNTSLNYTWTNMIEANKEFGDHTIKAFAGYEANRRQVREASGQLINYRSLDPRHRYLNQALGTFNTINSFQTIQTLLSVFGKLDYEWNDKVLFSATIRRDGSSNFVQDKYKVFPAFTLGYRISEESFMQGVDFISDLKIRGGWGMMGNQRVSGRYNTYNQFGSRTLFDASYDITGSDNTAEPGLTRTSIGNAETSWETNTTTNIGLDATFLEGKVTFVLDVYNKVVDDLLYAAPLAGSAGNADVPVSNVAKMTNKGFDISLGYRGNITPDLGFNADLNLSHYKNEINSLDGSASFVFPGGVDKRFGEVNAWMVGQPIASYYGYQLDGIFRSQAEVDEANAADGDPASPYQAGIQVGRFRWKDINNDGAITDDDKGPIGNPHPKVTIGLNLGFNYKAFDFNMFIFGSFGNKIYNYNKLFTHFGQFASNIHEEVLGKSWSPENPGGSLPAIDGTDTFSNTSSSFYVENGSYVRATNITLGYTLPNVSSVGFERVRIYAQAQNLFTITKYSGIDPALSSVGVGGNRDDGWAGFDFGNYPSSRGFLIGVNLGF